MNIKNLPKISSRKFTYENSTYGKNIAGNTVIDYNMNLLDGWTAIGWCPNESLAIQRPDDGIPPTSMWVGVLFEKEDGDNVWLHFIIDR